MPTPTYPETRNPVGARTLHISVLPARKVTVISSLRRLRLPPGGLSNCVVHSGQ
jgi:hypothetical protein